MPYLSAGVLSGFGTLKSTFGRYNGEWEGELTNTFVRPGGRVA